MRAEYTCVSAFGRTFTVEADIKDPVEKIKELAATQHHTIILEVVGEKPLGNHDDEEEENEDDDDD